MADRITKTNVLGIFESYVRAAGNVGYDTAGWNIKIVTGPLMVSATKGQTGTDSVEPLPGFSSPTLGITYRDVYAALMTATRTLQALAQDRPAKSARTLYKYVVGGRYGTCYVDLYYDIDRDGSYKDMVDSALEEGSRKKMQRLADKFNGLLSADPLEPAYHDKNVRYLPHSK